VPLLVVADLLNLLFGEPFCILLYILDVQIVAVLERRGLRPFTDLPRLLRVDDVLFASFGAFALLALGLALLLVAHVLSALFREVALRLAVVYPGPSVAFLGLPLLVRPLLEVLLGLILLALVTSASLLVLLGQQLGLARAPLALLAALVGRFDLFLDP
jgi:hypothetical protein